jgi:phenylacetic acid degradation protein
VPSYRFENHVPVVHPTAFVHPTAVLIGDVVVGPGCYVGPGASLRGDFGYIRLEAGCNVQDNCVLHSFPNGDMVVGENGHVAHGAILHGCIVGRDALVGMNAVVMDGTKIGEQAFIAAMSFVKAGFEVPARTLVAGVPAKVIRPLEEKEMTWKSKGTVIYQQLAQRCLASLEECQPLAEEDPDKPRGKRVESVPLHVLKAKTGS